MPQNTATIGPIRSVRVVKSPFPYFIGRMGDVLRYEHEPMFTEGGCYHVKLWSNGEVEQFLPSEIEALVRPAIQNTEGYRTD